MLRKTKRIILRVIFVLVALWIIFVPVNTVKYLLSEFIFCVNTYPLPKTDTSQKDIPKRLHQVFFFETTSTLPHKFQKAQQSCIEQHPAYSYTLWNKTMVDELIDREYPEIKDLYNSYNRWVKRADVARYLILHHLGGWYIDMDIVCKRSLDELSTEAKVMGASVIVRETGPVGFSNDFIGISRRHLFLNEIINALHHSNKIWYFIPYPSTMFSTGPMFLWGRYLNYPHQKEFHVINNHAHYLEFLHGSSWHSVDGKLIWYFFRYRSDIWLVLAVMLTAVSVLLHLRGGKFK